MSVLFHQVPSRSANLAKNWDIKVFLYPHPQRESLPPTLENKDIIKGTGEENEINLSLYGIV